MPPPLRCPSLIPSISCTNEIFRSAHSRSFSITSQRDQRTTRARRALFRWLETRGNSFLQPLEGSTNYLSAYNAQGQLTRVANQKVDEKKERETEQENEGGENPAPKDPNAKQVIPPETPRDLRVFPQNPAFISQPVLSEEFREAIWDRVWNKGQSVREVSAALRVEMSRVGAVVRLKTIEKDWQRIVSFFSQFLFFGDYYDDL